MLPFQITCQPVTGQPERLQAWYHEVAGQTQSWCSPSCLMFFLSLISFPRFLCRCVLAPQCPSNYSVAAVLLRFVFCASSSLVLLPYLYTQYHFLGCQTESPCPRS